MRRVIDRARDEERGAFLVLFAVVLMVLVAMLALVLDLVSLRLDERADHSVADYAATAGAAMMDPLFGGTPHAGCLAAWQYFAANATDPSSAASDPCGPFAAYPRCDPAMPPTQVTKAIGDLVVTILTPVPNLGAEMEGRHVPEVDGEPCQRIAVTVHKKRTYLFAGVMKQSSGTTTITSVARSGSRTSQGESVALIVLDPTGCNALLAKGQGKVRVNSSATLPGIIAVDSSGTEASSAVPTERRCTNAGTYAIDATGTQNSSIESQASTSGTGTIPGVIYSYALTPGQGNASSYDPVDVATDRLRPVPVPGQRVTRAPVDFRYNCSFANSCPFTSTQAPHIDNLRASIGTSGIPAGFIPYLGPCKTVPGTPPIVLTGNIYVTCPSFDISSSVTFLSGSVVFEGSVSVGSSSGALSINNVAISDEFVYVRNGSLTKDSQASISMKRTMVYLHNGYFSFGAGSGAVTWIAPTAGNFEDLALWSESTASHDLGGQANLNIEGIFFTPNAYPFRFSGQGGQYQEKAQFIVYRLEITGQGELIMNPDPERMLLVPILGVRLLR